MNEIGVVKEKFGLLDNFPLGIFVLREDYAVLFWNSQMEIWTGVPRNKIMGENLTDHFPNLNEPKYAHRIQLIFDGGPPVIFSSLLHKYIIPSSLGDGQFRVQDVSVISVPKEDVNGFYALFTIQDVTDLTHRIRGYKVMRDQAHKEVQKRKLAEEQLKKYSLNLEAMIEKRTSELNGAIKNLQNTQSQLIQSEKMASIGQLAAGVAHEINNPTGFISSNLITLAEYEKDIRSLFFHYKELISNLKTVMVAEKGLNSIAGKLETIEAFEEEIDIDFIFDDFPNLVKECSEGSERIKKIVIDLKNFAHPGNQERQYADINRNLSATLNIVRNELKYKASVKKDYGDLPEVLCHPQQLNQVFMNLLVNAAQAIEKNGEIKIQTRAANGFVEIRISDTGAGIPKENILKIFDPFFTTKDVGKGTGLGLNVSYNIIKEHNGTIEVDSTVGQGTIFTVRIPVQ